MCIDRVLDDIMKWNTIIVIMKSFILTNEVSPISHCWYCFFIKCISYIFFIQLVYCCFVLNDLQLNHFNTFLIYSYFSPNYQFNLFIWFTMSHYFGYTIHSYAPFSMFSNYFQLHTFFNVYYLCVFNSLLYINYKSLMIKNINQKLLMQKSLQEWKEGFFQKKKEHINSSTKTPSYHCFSPKFLIFYL